MSEDEADRRAARERRRWRWAGVLLLLAAVVGSAIGTWFRKHPLPPAYDSHVDAGKWPIPPPLPGVEELDQWNRRPQP